MSDLRTRIEVRSLAQRERLRQSERFDERARQFLDQKIEGVVEAPLGICVCCDHGDPGAEILGRGTIPETDVCSTACAIENLWLAAPTRYFAEPLFGATVASGLALVVLVAVTGAGILVALAVSVWAQASLGGRAGDTLGATVAAAEVAVCLTLLAFATA